MTDLAVDAPVPGLSRAAPSRRRQRADRRRFRLALGGIVLVALAWRVLYVLLFTRYENAHLYDDGWYDLQALALSTGHFFSVPFGTGPDAAHPPLTSIVLVPVTYLFGLHQGETPQRLTMAALGTVVVLLTGLLARSLAGPRVGLVAAAVAAAYPSMWLPNGIVMSETLTMLFVALVLLGVYRLFRAPTWQTAVLVGLAAGLEMLVRAELALLVPCLVVPAILALRGVPWSRRFLLAGLAVLVAALTVGPWVGRNLASFEEATFLSTGEGPVLAGANCPSTYYGPAIGSWSITCSIDVPPAAEQSVESARQAAAGLHYAEHHLRRLPLVVLARVGRVWDVFRPVPMAHQTVDEGRPVPGSLAGLCSYYVLVPFAVLGAVALRRRRVRVWPLLVIAGVVTLVAAASYGLVRFRAEFEVPFVVLAAVGLEAAVRRVGRRVSRWGRPRGAARRPAPG